MTAKSDVLKPGLRVLMSSHRKDETRRGSEETFKEHPRQRNISSDEKV